MPLQSSQVSPIFTPSLWSLSLVGRVIIAQGRLRPEPVTTAPQSSCSKLRFRKRTFKVALLDVQWNQHEILNSYKTLITFLSGLRFFCSKISSKRLTNDQTWGSMLAHRPVVEASVSPSITGRSSLEINKDLLKEESLNQCQHLSPLLSRLNAIECREGKKVLHPGRGH